MSLFKRGFAWWIILINLKSMVDELRSFVEKALEKEFESFFKDLETVID